MNAYHITIRSATGVYRNMLVFADSYANAEIQIVLRRFESVIAVDCID